jgi:hypothetical protein
MEWHWHASAINSPLVYLVWEEEEKYVLVKFVVDGESENCQWLEEGVVNLW